MIKTICDDALRSANEIVFVFPGQGSYHRHILQELYAIDIGLREYFYQADAIAQRFLRHEFLPLVNAQSEAEHAAVLRACPNLDQLGIFICNIGVASLLMRAGIKPSLLVGHSFGELSALTVSGAYDVETGLKIICQRVLSLRASGDCGAMAAVSCDVRAAAAHIHESGLTDIEIAVINHARQTVVSGPRSLLERFAESLRPQGIGLTVLKSRYPFHSSLLRPSVAPFREHLAVHEFRSPQIPVLLGTEGHLWSPETDLAETLSRQFVRALDFQGIVSGLYAQGYRAFVECGAGDMLTKLLATNLEDAGDTLLLTGSPLDKGVRQGVDEVVRIARENRLTLAPEQAGVEDVAANVPPGHALMATMMGNLTTLVSNMSALVDNTAALMRLASRAGFGDALHAIPEARRLAELGRDISRLGQANRSEGSHETVFESPRTVRAETAESGIPQLPLRNSPETRSAPAEASTERARLTRVVEQAERRANPPVAIVALGCVLPGAANAAQFWDNVKRGVSGIVDLAQMEPSIARDFLAGSVEGGLNIVADKTYTLLNGTIVDIAYAQDVLETAYTRQEFESMTRGQRLLALAVGQAVSSASTKAALGSERNLNCILGATADGSAEFDEARFLDSLVGYIEELGDSASLRDAARKDLEALIGYRAGDSHRLTQHRLYHAVAQKLLGASCKTYIVDSACSSSLYSVDIGVERLLCGASDVVVCGGVFAPGPANNTLFAQFRGLTPVESRPLDKNADGVVFGEGAAVVVLKRLTDALRDDDRVLGVIRGVGVSSDGKSPAVNVPQAKGQLLALRRAYKKANVSTETIQYIEAHATATQVGDAVELSALKEMMEGRDPGLRKVQLGSVKALIGHTGWVSGVASIIKICKMFEYREIPPQYNFTEPSSEFGLEDSPFTISKTASRWPPNQRDAPRRAGVNGFGFGGTNAHIVLEEFDPDYHRSLCQQHIADGSCTRTRNRSLAVVAIGGLFPSRDRLHTESGLPENPQAEARFRRDLLRLPVKKILLPDVQDHMDISQYLAALGAEAVLSGVPEYWQTNRQSIGVVLGLESKTERGVRANERIYLDRLKRLLLEADLPEARRRIIEAVIERIQNEVIPSGAYTLSGLMPNVAASRITHMYDLNGPNVIVDMGENSLLQAIHIANHLIDDECRLMIAGGINAAADKNSAEAAVMVALMDEGAARAAGVSLLAIIDPIEDGAISEARDASGAATDYRGAQGGVELIRAIMEARDQGKTSHLRAFGSSPAPKALTIAPAERSNGVAAKEAEPRSADARALPASHAYVQDTPIACYTPIRVNRRSSSTLINLKTRHILFLCDQTECWLEIERSGALDGLRYSVMFPNRDAGDFRHALSADLLSDESVARSLSEMQLDTYDTVIAVADLSRSRADDLLVRGDDQLGLIDLLFCVTRHCYRGVRAGSVQLVTLCLGAFRGTELDPFTGLVAGFMKSVARECPQSVCRIVNTDSAHFRDGLFYAATELGNPQSIQEVCYEAGVRSEIILRPLQELSDGSVPCLSRDSVVIATGGGRGVTAALCEEILVTYGCRVIALGRTPIESAPPTIRDMDEDSFRNYEAQFYREELSRNGGGKIIELRSKYKNYQAVNEISQTLRRLEALPGSYEYVSLDINDEQAVDRVVERVYENHGRVDCVIHGAGVQISTSMEKKSLADFRRIVATKVSSLGNLYRAIASRSANRPVHYHLLTSAFSYMGNDGQPDYGAANEAMNRLAACKAASDPNVRWSSMAWLGWAGIGMTRGSEYAALAASRSLRGVTKEEGRKIFAALMAGRAQAAVNVLLSEGEIVFYGVDVGAAEFGPAPNQLHMPLPAKRTENRDATTTWRISLENAPFLADHVVNGMVTVPAAFLTSIVAETARERRPDLKIVAFEDARYHKFVRVPDGRETELRVTARAESEDANNCLLRFEIHSDFVHKSGTILQQNVLHKSIAVRMASAVPVMQAQRRPATNEPDIRLPDPYVHPTATVRLSGRFDSMTDIRVGRRHRAAVFRLRPSAHQDFEYQRLVLNTLMLDACWRFGAIHRDSDGALPLYVPEACERMRICFDFDALERHPAAKRLDFRGDNPRAEGGRLRLGAIEILDPFGEVLVSVEGAVCRRFGEVLNAPPSLTA